MILFFCLFLYLIVLLYSLVDFIILRSVASNNQYRYLYPGTYLVRYCVYSVNEIVRGTIPCYS